MGQLTCNIKLWLMLARLVRTLRAVYDDEGLPLEVQDTVAVADWIAMPSGMRCQ
jgi:hypothetical protein